LAKLFLSYAREDAGKARQLVSCLEIEGHSVWWDDAIKGGETFSREIERALSDSDAILVLWSQTSVESSWVRDEAAVGREAGKLLPLRLDRAPPPLGFRQLQGIDLSSWNGRRRPTQFDRITQSIASLTTPGGKVENKAASNSTRHFSFKRPAMIIGAVLMLVAAAIVVWKITSNGPSITVAVVPSSSTGDPKLNRSYAASIGSDIATLLAAQAQDASVLESSSSDPKGGDFRFDIAVTSGGPSAEAFASLSVPKERRIIWSEEWKVPNLSKTDLRQQMAYAAARALQCSLEGMKGGLRGSLVNTYITACAAFSAGDEAENDLVGIYTQLSKQAPGFAPVWADLAVLYGSQVMLLIYEDKPVPAELRQRTIEAVQKARQLNPNSGKAYMAEGALAGKDRLTHLKMVERAVEVEPSTAMLHAVLAFHLRTVGRMNESIEEAKKAVALDPLSSGARAAYIRALVEGGRITKATDELTKAEKIWPNSPSIQEATLGVNANYGDPKRAEQFLSTLSSDEEGLARFRVFLRARESPTQSNIAATIANSRSVVEANPLAADRYVSVLATFGKTDDVFVVLRDPRYRRFVDSSTLFLPEFKQVRADVRFMAVANDFGLVKYWTVSGHWPDYCSTPGISYNCATEARKYALHS
jgi:tetratricopeptide (TPR) repeat protein